MSRKSKGTNAERELIHMFWENGWAAMRAAGSGSSRHPSPDILAGNVLRKLAIECKTRKEDTIYIPKEDITQLEEFAAIFGAEPWLGIRFSKNEWFFISLDDARQTMNNYTISAKLARQKGLLFEELIEKGNLF